MYGDRAGPRGFTLIEIIVVIGVMMFMLGLLLPALHHIRQSALDSASTANMRTHAQVVQLYAGDFRDMAPFIADPDATYTVARGGGLTVTFEFFGAEEMWGVALADRYYGFGLGSSQWDEYVEWGIFARPGLHGFLYQYSPTFFTRPPYWDKATRDEGQLRPVRVSSVRYPASKAVFLEGDGERGFPSWRNHGMAGRNLGWAFAFADGSVSRPDADHMVKPCPIGEGSANGGRFSYGVVGLHTRDGILGRDVE